MDRAALPLECDALTRRRAQLLGGMDDEELRALAARAGFVTEVGP